MTLIVVLGIRKLASMRLKFHVKQRGRLCIITGDDGRIRREVPRSLLCLQMESYDVVGERFQELCDALDVQGEAIVEGIERGMQFSRL